MKVFRVGTGTWAPVASPWPLALQAQALTPPSLFAPGLGCLPLGQLGSPGLVVSMAQSTAQHSLGGANVHIPLTLGTASLVPRRGSNRAGKRGHLQPRQKSSGQTILQLPKGKCAQFTGLEGRAVTSASC